MRLALGLAAAATLLVGFGMAHAASGASLYAAHCVLCHQADGNGSPGVYPPLAGTVGSYVGLKQGRAYLAHVVSSGINGKLVVRGQTYNGFMSPFPQLSDKDLAELLNYVLTSFNAGLLPKDFTAFTPAEVKQHRAANPSQSEVARERQALMDALKKAGVVK